MSYGPYFFYIMRTIFACSVIKYEPLNIWRSFTNSIQWNHKILWIYQAFSLCGWSLTKIYISRLHRASMNSQHFIVQLMHIMLKNVELLKNLKTKETAPTCFGLQGNHHQGATDSTSLKLHSWFIVDTQSSYKKCQCYGCVCAVLCRAHTPHRS